MRSDVTHFRCEIANRIATVTLDRPDRKNPLTFDSCLLYTSDAADE